MVNKVTGRSPNIWNAKINFCVCWSLPLDPILNPLKPAQFSNLFFLIFILKLFSNLHLSFSLPVRRPDWMGVVSAHKSQHVWINLSVEESHFWENDSCSASQFLCCFGTRVFINVFTRLPGQIYAKCKLSWNVNFSAWTMWSCGTEKFAVIWVQIDQIFVTKTVSAFTKVFRFLFPGEFTVPNWPDWKADVLCHADTVARGYVQFVVQFVTPDVN